MTTVLRYSPQSGSPSQNEPSPLTRLNLCHSLHCIGDENLQRHIYGPVADAETLRSKPTHQERVRLDSLTHPAPVPSPQGRCTKGRFCWRYLSMPPRLPWSSQDINFMGTYHATLRSRPYIGLDGSQVKSTPAKVIPVHLLFNQSIYRCIVNVKKHRL